MQAETVEELVERLRDWPKKIQALHHWNFQVPDASILVTAVKAAGLTFIGPPSRLSSPLSADQEAKLDEWVSAKRARDFETADRLRQELAAAQSTVHGLPFSLQNYFAAQQAADA